MAIRNDIIGKGIKYPIEISGGNMLMQPSVTRADFEESVNQRLAHVFGTLVGERVPRRNWGSYLKTLIFKPSETTEFESKASYFARESVEENEGYIYVVDVKINPTTKHGDVDIQVSYADVESNRFGQFAYPFNTRKPSIDLNIES